MRAHYKYILRGILLACLTIVFLTMITRILIPKYYYNSTWPVTATYQGFYEMKKDTIDVIFLGSSHAAAAFNPQYLYNAYEISSYNLGCEQQNLLVSYYWLKEALRFQSPKVVILDIYMLFAYKPDEPLNSAESCIRKALDYMKWSPVKVDAIKDICQIDEKQSLISYYLPNIRFHNRWTKLSEDDFTNDLGSHYELKGFSPLMTRSIDIVADRVKAYRPLDLNLSNEAGNTVDIMEDYLNRIIDLCNSREIKLILVKTPTSDANLARYNAARKIAEENNLAYYDFNEKSLYNAIRFNFSVDAADARHTSISGAIKVTDFLGNLLIKECDDIKKKKDVQWEETKDFYECLLKEYEIIYTTDIYTYLDLINDERYSIFISAKENALTPLNEQIVILMRKLGLTVNFEDNKCTSYLAIINNGAVYEDVGYEKLEYSGTIRNGITKFTLISSGSQRENISSIILDEKDYSKNKRGLNIVVYDNVLKKIVDSVNFDTFTSDFIAIR